MLMQTQGQALSTSQAFWQSYRKNFGERREAARDAVERVDKIIAIQRELEEDGKDNAYAYVMEDLAWELNHQTGLDKWMGRYARRMPGVDLETQRKCFQEIGANPVSIRAAAQAWRETVKPRLPKTVQAVIHGAHAMVHEPLRVKGFSFGPPAALR